MKKKAKTLHQLEKPLYLRHWLNAKENLKNGKANPCFCANVAKVQEEEGFSDDQAAYIAGTLLEAGSDTTSNTLYGFIQAMVVFPEVQTKAQEEIDRVCGDSRLPGLEDEPNLPYIRACVKETLRWMPTTPTGGVPHAVTQDDKYMGYTIPKAAGVMINTWAIHMDPNRYPDPRRFNPDRFEGDTQNSAEAANNPDVSKRDHFAFGSGRRICPGMHVAERSLFLGMSRLLWAFDFQPQLDADGKPIIPDPERLTQGFVVRPEDFEAVITPRSKDRADLVEREWKIAQELVGRDSKQWKSTSLKDVFEAI
jgi:cytochrome P450